MMVYGCTYNPLYRAVKPSRVMIRLAVPIGPRVADTDPG